MVRPARAHNLDPGDAMKAASAGTSKAATMLLPAPTEPKSMLTRRALLAAATAMSFVGIVMGVMPSARAQGGDAATSFVDATGKALVATVNGNGSADQKKQALRTIIDRDVDVPEIARFCLGRFWRLATPQQQQDYTLLFHQVLVNNITGKIGDYKGVVFALGHSSPRAGDVAVGTVVTRPGNEPSRVDWLVAMASGAPKIIDIIAEGTSLRLTQRDDYSAFLSRNNNNVQALIDAMRRQTVQPS